MCIPAASDGVPPALARVLGGFGRVLITVGVLLLLFAGFQLWGTGLAEARAQEDLEQRFAARRADVLVVQATEPPPVLAATEPPELAATTALLAMPTAPGQPVGVIEIPAIGVRKAVVEGTSRDVLRSGPGHYRSTPQPGRAGNSAIAGHRTTHGAPFLDIDLLQPGDEIHVETLEGTATYVVEAHDDGSGGQVGHQIVDPSEVGVIADGGDDRLTLTACHPKYSAKQRIVVTATMVGQPESEPEPVMPQLPEPTAAITVRTELPSEELPFATLDELAIDEQAIVAASLGWQPEFAPATLLWALATALVAGVGWVVGRFWRRFPAYAMAVPPSTLALYYCFASLEKFIPAV